MAAQEPVLNPQPWPWSGPRVLIEHADEARTQALAAALRRAGFAVAVCPGPASGDHCPLAGDAGCATAHGADVVVSSLGLATPEAREALAALRSRVAPSRLLVEADAEQAAAWPELVAECDVVVPASPEDVVARVRAALEREAQDIS